MSIASKLQLRHAAEVRNFATRDEVMNYITEQLQYRGVTISPYEPILFFYGADNAKKTMIVIGLPEGKTQDGKAYFVVDTAKLQEEISGDTSKLNEIIEKVNQEIDERKAADEKISDSITQEITDRTNADETLKTSIEFSADDIQSLVDACGLIYKEKLVENRVSYEPDSHDEVIRDSKSLSDAIDKVSKFATQISQSLRVSVENTDTVDLTMEENAKLGGSVIKADVNIAGVDGLSKKTFDNNIIGKTTDGIYASASLEPSTTKTNTLVFKTSGYVNGEFKVDAFETEVPLSAYNGDNGKTSGVTVDVDSDKNVISAKINLSTNANNILKLEDGVYSVEGNAKNIKYEDTTVAQTLTNQTKRLDTIDEAIAEVKAIEINGSETTTSTVGIEKSIKGDVTITNNVKLGTDNSIVVANGGLQANVTAEYQSGKTTLVITVGTKKYEIDLSNLAVSSLKSADYDATNEEIVLTFYVGTGEKTLRIPVGTLIHDVEVDDTDTIDLTLKSVSGGPNRISGEVKIDKTYADNILTATSNGLYVSKAYITNAVKEETEARQEADKDLKSQINEVSTVAKTNTESIETEKNRALAAETTNANAVLAEKARAEKAEGDNATAIANEVKRANEKESDLQKAIDSNTAKITQSATDIATEASTARAAEKANAEAIAAETSRATLAEKDNANAVETEKNRAVAAETTNATAIANEVKRAEKAEQTNAANITAAKQELQANIDTKANALDVYTKLEINNTLSEYAKTNDVQTKLDAKLNVTDAQNVYATKESLQTVKDTYATNEQLNKVNTELVARIDSNKTSIDNFGLTYNAATSELTYTDKSGTKTVYKLYSGSLIKEGTYDSATKSIVLVIETAGIESKITIPVTDLVSDLNTKIEENTKAIETVNTNIGKLANKWDVNSSSSVYLEKTTTGESDALTAKIKLSTSNKQAIQSSDDGLYVSNDLEDFTVAFGSTGTISGQTAISTLLDTTTSIKTDVKTNADAIADLKERVTNLEKTVNTLSEKVNNHTTQLTEVANSINNLLGEITKINTVTGYETYTSAKTMSVRLDEIEATGTTALKAEIDKIENEIIGPKDGSVSGSIWAELNTMVDSGAY